jgi:hypothetical protein
MKQLIGWWVIAGSFAAAGMAKPAITTGGLPNGSIGSAYSATLQASGGPRPFTWTISNGALPDGLSLDPAGDIGGTPTASGTFNFTALVTGTDGTTDSKGLKIQVQDPPLSVTTGSLPDGATGTPYDQTLSASGGSGGYTWSITTGVLPAGLSLASNGAITGTPTAVGTSNFTVQVKDSSNTAAMKGLSIKVADPPLAVTTSSLPNGTVGTAYNQSLSATGGAGGYTWSTSGGSLPAGLSLAASGAITGTPTTSGTSNFTVQVKDSSNATATAALSITIAAPALSITTSSLPNGIVGAAYSQSLAAAGGSGGYTWSITAGSLPAGLSLAGSGSITGTPTASGTSNFTVQVKDSSNVTATKGLGITVAAPALSVTTSSLPGGNVGTAYNQSLSATGGSGGYTWSITAGSLPGGLSLAASGAITGTPTASGTSNFTVQVKDSSNATATAALSIIVAAPALSVSTSSLPGGTVGTAYSQSLSATGGSGGYTWSITAGSLPAGLSLAASGAITGTPTATGTSSFSVQVKDSSNATATAALSITIAAPALSVSTSSLPGGTVGTAYNQSLSATGGSGGYTWSITAGSLPVGLSLAASGAITGTPTAAGTSSFIVQVKDSSNTTATAALSITVGAPALSVSTSSLPGGTVGTTYSQSLSATGGSGGYTWSITTGSLPAGLSLAAGGAITGTPTATGTSNFTVQVKDSSNATATAALSITVGAPALSVATASLPGGTVGTAYNQSLSATGGSGGYSWSITAGSLPAGLSLAASGAITGTPTATGTSSFTVQVKDSSNTTATGALSITVAAPALSVSTSSLPSGTVGTAYNQSLSATGGSGGYTWSITAGSLSAGLSLAASGVISGTPTVAGTSSFTVQVKDSSNTTATAVLSITIAPPPLIITTSSLPGAVVGNAYSQTLTANGGLGNYTWSISSGSLPAGLTLSTSGLISGSPSAAGTSSFTAAVTDGSTSANRGFSIAVTAPIVISTTSLPTGVVGRNYSATIAATGGAGTLTWSVTSGALPDGLALDASSGLISGTPTASGTFNFTVAVADSATSTARASYTINVNPALAITTAATIATGSAGSVYSQTFTAKGGIGPYGWSLSGTLPNGLSFSSGVLSGTPTQVGTFPITVRVTDSTSASVSADYSVQIVSGLAIATPPVLPAATVGTAYSFAIQPAGGSAPYTWVVTAGSLPGGLNFSGSGQISGTPASAGSFSFTVQVTDANSAKASKQFTLTVAGPLSITSASLPNGTAGAAYSQTLTAAGGTPPYQWSVSAGTLPPGLALVTATGALDGTPSAAGSYTFTVTATDANSVSAQKQFQLTIGAGVSFSTPASLPAATVGASYQFQMQAAGGQPPYSFTITQGSLPGGLALNGTSGTISGTPTAAGTFNFTVQVTDSAKSSATRVHTLSVNVPNLPTVAISGLSSTVQALQQPLIDIAVASPYPVPITGTITLSFTPSGPNPADDPSVQFSTGGRSASFTIPANATHATFGAPQFAVQTGSVMGKITISIVSLQAGGTPLTVPPSSDMTAVIAAAPPIISSMSLVHTANGVQVQLTGVTDTRELTQVTVTFQPAAGNQIQNQQVTIPIGSIAGAWFGSSASGSYGGQFGMTIPFTFQGTVSLSAVSVVLSNGSGDSAVASANY